MEVGNIEEMTFRCFDGAAPPSIEPDPSSALPVINTLHRDLYPR